MRDRRQMMLPRSTTAIRYALLRNMTYGVLYSRMVAAARAESTDMIAWLAEELPYVWLDEYRKMTAAGVEVVRVQRGSFEYLYDAKESPGHESRVVAALGRSSPRSTARDDSRLSGWVGSTKRYFGDGWDKGHFIGHSLGGASTAPS